MTGDYVKSWDATKAAWLKRADVENFAKFAAAEFGPNPKAVQVDKDGKTYRVYIPLISLYWDPRSSDSDKWEQEFEAVKRRVAKWATA